MNNDGLNCGNPWGSMASPLEQWVTAVKTWTEFWSAFLPAGLLNSPQQAWNPGGVSQNGVGSPSSSVAVRVSSQRPTEVSATLTPGSEYLPLVAEVGNLPGISISRQGTAVRVEVEVAPAQAAGTYQGSIKAAGREVGTISVKILEPPAAAKTGPRTSKRAPKAS
jgi:hypothetical protein